MGRASSCTLLVGTFHGAFSFQYHEVTAPRVRSATVVRSATNTTTSKAEDFRYLLYVPRHSLRLKQTSYSNLQDISVDFGPDINGNSILTLVGG
jgi:hypothetical protein